MMNRIWVASAVIATACLASGMALADHETGPGKSGGRGDGFTTGENASGGRNGDAHFDGRGRDAPLDNAASGNPPSGELPGFGKCGTAGQCGDGSGEEEPLQ